MASKCSFDFLSRGKNDTIVLEIGKGHADANNMFHLDSAGLRAHFKNGIYSTDDPDIAIQVLASDAYRNGRVVFSKVNNNPVTPEVVSSILEAYNNDEDIIDVLPEWPAVAAEG